MQWRRLLGWVTRGKASTRALWIWAHHWNDLERRVPGRIVSFAEASCFQQADKLLERGLSRGWCKCLSRSRSRGAEESWSHRHSSLSCYTTVIVLGCKDKLVCAEVSWGSAKDDAGVTSNCGHTLHGNNFSLRKHPTSEKDFPNSSCLPQINPWGLTYIISPFDISG